MTIGHDPALDALATPPPALSPAEQAAATAAAQAATGERVPLPATARAEAAKRIAEYKANPEFITRYQRGDPATVKQWREDHKIVSSAPAADEIETRLADQIANQVRYGFPDPASELGKDLIGYLSGKKTITTAERRQVEARMASLKSDPEFVQKFLGGNLEARKTMRICTTLLTAQIKDAA
jgi:hypothetical protein